jgi:hypothetical protein
VALSRRQLAQRERTRILNELGEELLPPPELRVSGSGGRDARQDAKTALLSSPRAGKTEPAKTDEPLELPEFEHQIPAWKVS